MGRHVNAEGEFQSDKYPTCPAGKVPLSTRDPMARDLLAEYARRRASVDKEFSDDLYVCLHTTGVGGAELSEPVMGVSKYCDALRTWQSALGERAERQRVALYPDIRSEDRAKVDAAWKLYHEEKKMRLEVGLHHREMSSERGIALNMLTHYEEACERVGWVFTQIAKSCLLWRLIYDGQELRTVPCPVHEGHWSGCAWPEKPEDVCACMDGSNVTGWLPNEPKVAAP
jgi:hypothetical protein